MTTIEIGRDAWFSGAGLLGIAANQWTHILLPSEASQPLTGGLFTNPSALFDPNEEAHQQHYFYGYSDDWRDAHNGIPS
jgi:hypothetical protein